MSLPHLSRFTKPFDLVLYKRTSHDPAKGNVENRVRVKQRELPDVELGIGHIVYDQLAD